MHIAEFKRDIDALALLNVERDGACNRLLESLSSDGNLVASNTNRTDDPCAGAVALRLIVEVGGSVGCGNLGASHNSAAQIDHTTLKRGGIALGN